MQTCSAQGKPGGGLLEALIRCIIPSAIGVSLFQGLFLHGWRGYSRAAQGGDLASVRFQRKLGEGTSPSLMGLSMARSTGSMRQVEQVETPAASTMG